VFSNTKRGEIKRKRKRKQILLLRAKVEASRANAKAAQLRLKLNKLDVTVLLGRLDRSHMAGT
jgi:hypothetical protein